MSAKLFELILMFAVFVLGVVFIKIVWVEHCARNVLDQMKLDLRR